MLLEKRLEEILKLVEKNGSVTVQELTEHLKASESTIRRDLYLLDEEGKLNKVHGGATAINASYASGKDVEVEYRKNLNREEKAEIARYAASLIKPDDLVYLDAGTTTERVIDFITEKRAVYVTNAIGHAKRLVQAGCEAHILGGKFKLSTEAVVGIETASELEKFNFTIGFIGTNGISRRAGFSTPDIEEAMVKRRAVIQCRRPYILGDSGKFNQISPVTFAGIEDAELVTTEIKHDSFQDLTNIIETTKKQEKQERSTL
ncbi:DeoR/GlpR transcriptional regulator [Petralouisia muris]|jgi:DeoR family fructose operon transcriptional repressor|uniref:DeoR/GlpR transcriptional regulator n=1 Tax=Petralouisia muris TaxID=3032872 RepID=A0AC61RW36_9FIRM|nr:DeoR/GlpR family DNA-binding transcription regulator [Petralouisia muris]TGY96043.1 DeoR/GlpR transcriptional regulator [Petralouisia muris]